MRIGDIQVGAGRSLRDVFDLAARAEIARHVPKSLTDDSCAECGDPTPCRTGAALAEQLALSEKSKRAAEVQP